MARTPLSNTRIKALADQKELERESPTYAADLAKEGGIEVMTDLRTAEEALDALLSISTSRYSTRTATGKAAHDALLSARTAASNTVKAIEAFMAAKKKG